MMSSPAIRLERVSKYYGTLLAVDDISFDVRQGAVCALLGANGAGKTTTLAMLLGLLTPSSGRIVVLDEDLLRHRYRLLARMNFTSPYVDLPYRLTVAENLTVYARLYGIGDVRGRIKQLAVDLDIEATLHRPYAMLSAGQKTRAGLAKALLNHPEVLLLDEPTASLDPDSADRIRGYLMDYQRSSGATVLLASHNMVEVERLCSRVIMLRNGRIIDEGTPAGLVERHGRRTLEEVFLAIARHQDGRPSGRWGTHA